MDERLESALAAIQRVEEVLVRYEDTAWGRAPEALEIRDAIADIDTESGGFEPVLGAAPPVDERRLSTRSEHDFRLGDDGVQRCVRCSLGHARWAGGSCPGVPTDWSSTIYA
jgi:hypothetical protein